MFVNEKDCIYSERINVNLQQMNCRNLGLSFCFCMCVFFLFSSSSCLFCFNLQLKYAALYSSQLLQDTTTTAATCAPPTDTARYRPCISRLYVFRSHFFGGQPDITASAIDARNLSSVNREAIG